jgi:ribosome maturation factor RimP
MASELEREIERLIAPALDGLGFAVVRVKLLGNAPRTLQVMAERQRGDGMTVDAKTVDAKTVDAKTVDAMTVDDCSEISRVVSALLDVEEPISGSYSLEVSSPGIDRPLVRADDFERFAGHLAKIETRRPLDGRKRFRGQLLGVAGDDVRVMIDGGVAAIPFADITAAKLVLTDELIAASQELERG